MDDYEYMLWEAEYMRSPWHEERADLRAGIIASTIANFAGKSLSQSAPNAKPLDYMPYSQPEPEEVVPDIDYLKDFISG